ncbi:hypothetical protein [uncultured Roseobacter sp.]|uniref:hypothetical protein n=1 Tax=uncultured Roseobacter sp. TaxID=114847 RepID=UPI0026052215|nr:hypothetical protein [uncultured Roseobacter sp.]
MDLTASSATTKAKNGFSAAQRQRFHPVNFDGVKPVIRKEGQLIDVSPPALNLPLSTRSRH